MNLDIDVKPFQVTPGDKFDLASFPTKLTNFRYSESECEDGLSEMAKTIRKLQDKLYASDSWGVLVVLQGMDTAGKSGIVENVFGGIKPHGLQVHAFGKPSTEDYEHDFLWRCEKAMPERGRVGIFDRSYYEEVIVVRVHPEFLDAQKLPKNLRGSDIWKMRYEDINAFEARQASNGFRIKKFFLNISKDEQRERLYARLNESSKNWKAKEGDIIERGHWDEYIEGYQQCLRHTSTEVSPWYVVPADEKVQSRVIVAQVMIESLQDLKLKYPTIDPKEIARLKALLENE